jgi:hypothetical protein
MIRVAHNGDQLYGVFRRELDVVWDGLEGFWEGIVGEQRLF